jgi:hypothetical protein
MNNRILKRLLLVTVLLLPAVGLVPLAPGRGQEPAAKPRDPAAWGGNHASQPVPEYVQGDECLFCHRNEIGPSWVKDPHALTVRYREASPEVEALLTARPDIAKLAPEVTHYLGSRHFLRLLKKDGYGKFALASVQLQFPADRQNATRTGTWSGSPTWDRQTFAIRCAGCHSTGIDPENRTFSGFGLDCYTCHGNVDLDHTKDKSLVWFSKKRRSDAKAITSICAQCHLREGKSQSTGLPYPNNFIAGDNLFQDFKVDFARADDPSLNAGDRHIWRNVRDVAVNGDESITCLSCHQLHGDSIQKHRRVLRAPICSECHAAEGSFKEVRQYTVSSPLCGY